MSEDTVTTLGRTGMYADETVEGSARALADEAGSDAFEPTSGHPLDEAARRAYRRRARHVLNHLAASGLLLPPGGVTSAEHAVKLTYPGVSEQVRYMPALDGAEALRIADSINQGDHGERAEAVTRTIRTYPTGAWQGVWGPVGGSG